MIVVTFNFCLNSQQAADIAEEKCECYGYSTSCMIQRCRKILKDFKHTAKLLRSRWDKKINYLFGIIWLNFFKKYFLRYTEARMIHEAEALDRRRIIRSEKNRFYYIKQSPNFCSQTHGRECRDEINCSVLCCARGFRSDFIINKRKSGKRSKKNGETKLYCK